MGQTGTSFRLRFNNHKKSINDNLINFHVSQHFNEHDHNLSNLRCILIDFNYSSLSKRLASESKWILKLNTHNKGLNKDLGLLSDFRFIKDH